MVYFEAFYRGEFMGKVEIHYYFFLLSDNLVIRELEGEV